jgi:hypothetical protein
VKTDKELLAWLKANLGPVTGALTSHDMHALRASVALTPLLSWSGAEPGLFDAYRSVVLEMQESTRWLAYHAVAFELDWGHREMLWQGAQVPTAPHGKCAYEPGGGGDERSKVLNKKGGRL